MTDAKPRANGVLLIEGATRTFGPRRRKHVAVNGVSLKLFEEETLAVVGESGSGKSTLAKMVCGLLKADSGEMAIGGQRVDALKSRELWKLIQMVPQDSWGSLNPALSIQTIVAEPIRFYDKRSWDEARRHADDLLEEVGLDPAIGSSSPNDVSGGQRQRVAIARALAVKPRVLVCDESTSALDVSVQAQILALLERLQKDRGFSLLFISHDIGVVKHIADRVLVMQDGQVVEEVSGKDLDPAAVKDEYTVSLLEAVPVLRYKKA